MHLRCTSGDISGPDKTILNSPFYVDRDRIEMHLFYLKKKIDANFRIPERARRMGVEHFAFVEESSQLDPVARARVGRYLDEHGIDILHTHDYKTDWWGWLLRRRRPHLKLMTTVHGWGVINTFRERVYYQLGKLPLYFFDCIVSVNREIIRSLRRIGVPASRMVFIPNAIDCQVFQRTTPPPGAGQAINIGYIGRLSLEKQVHVLIEAFGRLREHPALGRLLIAGEGNRLAELKSLVARLNLNNRVSFLGHVDARWFFEQVGIFVNPSLKEGLPNTLLESMAMEAVVIATPVGGIPEVLLDGQTGLRIRPGQVADLTSKLRWLLEHPQERLAMVRAARELITTRYSFRHRMQRMQQLYIELCTEVVNGERIGAIPAD
ncbi:MAG: glycosyltransferase family 1 protein [Calditrichaeota bacterium]|nr:MAG: glycosyltransferase family 1 protein [Calditrichota bacterium]